MQLSPRHHKNFQALSRRAEKNLRHAICTTPRRVDSPTSFARILIKSRKRYFTTPNSLYTKSVDKMILRTNHEPCKDVSPLSRLAWLSLILSLATRASAFQSSGGKPLAMVRTKSPGSFDNHHFGKEQLSRRASSVSTRLQYRDGEDDPSVTIGASSAGSSWWGSIFSSQPAVGEQDVVDDYLEFLDRRYRRLHSNEKEEENEKNKPFSAINWLLQGSSKQNDEVVSRQQQDDALYVLGVAGLASEKLLQKHALHVETKRETKAVKEEYSDAIYEYTVDVTAESESASVVFIKKIVVPILRVIYITQRRKEIFINTQLRRLAHVLSTGTRSAARAVIRGPLTTTKAMLELVGGKKNVVRTLALVSTVLLLLRPVLKAALTEGSVTP